jgi:hypothetical protein
LKAAPRSRLKIRAHYCARHCVNGRTAGADPRRISTGEQDEQQQVVIVGASAAPIVGNTFVAAASINRMSGILSAARRGSRSPAHSIAKRFKSAEDFDRRRVAPGFPATRSQDNWRGIEKSCSRLAIEKWQDDSGARRRLQVIGDWAPVW